MKDLVRSSGSSGASVVDPEPGEKCFLALSHFFTPSPVVGSLRLGLGWIGAAGASDRNEGGENDPSDEEETLDLGGAWGMPNPASVRRFSMACFLSLSGSGNRPVASEESDTWVAGSAQESIPGPGAQSSIASTFLLLSAMPGDDHMYFDGSSDLPIARKAMG